jgi:integrase
MLNDLEVDDVSQDDYEEVGVNWLTANREKVTAKTTGRRLTSLRQYARWAKWPITFEDYIAPVPLKGQPHPLPEGVLGIRRMVEKANDDRHKALLALCGLCGLRVAEALNVRPSHFDLETMDLWIRGKGNKERKVPVSPEAWEILQPAVGRAYCNGNDLVVGLKDRFARALITTTAQRAGLKRRVASHDLRATFATAVYDNTRDQRLVQVLLGHASGTTTEIYIGVSDDTMRQGVRL